MDDAWKTSKARTNVNIIFVVFLALYKSNWYVIALKNLAGPLDHLMFVKQ